MSIPKDHPIYQRITPLDLENLQQQGISIKMLSDQLKAFEQGFPQIKIDRPAFAADGVIELTEVQLEQYEQGYAKSTDHLDLCKFVPASGAASRMFKDLLLLLSQDRINHSDICEFTGHLPKFAFYQQLTQVAKQLGYSIDGLIKEQKYHKLLELLLGDGGINYMNLPKALITFHCYAAGTRTALEEHFQEALGYAKGINGIRIHFTLNKEHEAAFLQITGKILPHYRVEAKGPVEVTFSHQSPATDTLAVDTDNLPIRRFDHRIITRPGGHGALLSNLNQIEADILFIKNVDNVCPDHLKPLMMRYKKSLVGVLLTHQAKVFDYLRQLDSLKRSSEPLLIEMVDYLQSALGKSLGSYYHRLPLKERAEILYDQLNRPIRVCSVIPTEKVTGGGPYWVSESNGDTSLQIVEHAQLSEWKNHAKLEDSKYGHITDLVCAVKNYKGVKFNLEYFANAETGFITEKNYQGIPIRALEHPGLWNGGMANWHTILVAVPSRIFHPVKTVWDLLSPDHQPEAGS